MRDAFIRRLCTCAKNNSRIFLITGDLGFKVLDPFVGDFPQQFLNAGVAEQNMIGVATGMALEGRIVFVYSIGNFPSLRCLEQIRNDALYHQANVKIVSIGAGFSYGSLGMSHHATEDVSILSALPGMTVVSPGDDWEAEEATSALIDTAGAAYLRLDRVGAQGTQLPDERFKLGSARKVRDGDDATIIASGGMLKVALEAADELARRRITSRVLSMHTLSPFDSEAVQDAAIHTGGIVTLEEHTVRGGLGGIVAELLLETNTIPRFFYRLGLRSGFCALGGSQEQLRTRHGIDAASVVSRVEELVQNKSKTYKHKIVGV